MVIHFDYETKGEFKKHFIGRYDAGQLVWNLLFFLLRIFYCLISLLWYDFETITRTTWRCFNKIEKKNKFETKVLYLFIHQIWWKFKMTMINWVFFYFVRFNLGHCHYRLNLLQCIWHWVKTSIAKIHLRAFIEC